MCARGANTGSEGGMLPAGHHPDFRRLSNAIPTDPGEKADVSERIIYDPH